MTKIGLVGQMFLIIIPAYKQFLVTEILGGSIGTTADFCPKTLT